MEVARKQLRIPGYQNRPMAADLTFLESQDQMNLVIYAHGINGFKDWGGMDLVAEEFAQAGLAFLKFNFSLNGTTPEHPKEFVDLEAYSRDNYSIRQYELKQVVDFVSSGQLGIPVKQISLIGHSRGGTDVILYTPHDNRISKVISWAAVSQANTPWQSWDKTKMKEWRENGIIYRKNGRTGQQMPIGYQLYEDYSQNKQRLDVEEASRSIKIPWLIAHGTDDEAVFVKNAYDLKSWQPEASVSIIENTGHTFGRSHPLPDDQLPEPSKKLVKRCISFIEKG